MGKYFDVGTCITFSEECEFCVKQGAQNHRNWFRSLGIFRGVKYREAMNMYRIVVGVLLDVRGTRGPGSVVGIATGYGLDGPGIESWWGEIFRISPDWPWGPPSLLYNGYRIFPGGKERPGRDADSSPPSSAVVMKG